MQLRAETNQGKRFVVLATPRSGSNWLCTLLDSHPDILCHHELFNPDGIHIAWSQRGGDFELGDTSLRREQPLQLLEQAWQCAPEGATVGFKFNIGQDQSVFEAVLNDASIKKILLSRCNRVRAFLSEHIAELTGQWESYPDSNTLVHAGPVEISVDALLEHAARNRQYCDGIRDRLQRRHHQVFQVEYEAIGDPLTQRELLTFLGVDAARELQGLTCRMNPGPLHKLIVNLPELRLALAGTDFEQDLSEDENG